MAGKRTLDQKTLDDIIWRIVEVAQPEKIILFGSAARGEMGSDSDVDLLVEFERPVGLFHFFTVQHYLEDILGVAQVDLVMPDALHKELKEGILREAIHAT